MDDPRVGSVLTRLRRQYAAYTWERVTLGCSEARTFRLDEPRGDARYVKVAATPDLSAEAARMTWLAAHSAPVPAVVDTGELDGVQWLVTTAIPGRTAAHPWPVHQRDAVIDAVADALEALHALPAEECPFDRTLDTALAGVRNSLEDGQVDDATDELDRPGLLAELEQMRPEIEDVVVCHGDYCLPNVLLDPDTLAVTGLIDLGRAGRADRYADLTQMQWSIASPTLNPQYGDEHVTRFLLRYGADSTDPRLRYCQRLDWLR